MDENILKLTSKNKNYADDQNRPNDLFLIQLKENKKLKCQYLYEERSNLLTRKCLKIKCCNNLLKYKYL